MSTPGLTLVFDFGGGTLDLAVVRRERGMLEVLATAGRNIGGDRLTERVIDDIVAPQLGSRATWSPKRLRLPAFIVNALHDWHALSALNEKPLLEALDDLVRQGAPKRELAALRSAIELQLGYEIFMTADVTKIELSSAPAAILSYHHAAVDVDARLTRGRFERLIGNLLTETETLITDVLVRAPVSSADIAEVVTTGGSSAIPAFRALLARRFPNARVRDAAAFTSVAAGLAMPGVEESPADAMSPRMLDEMRRLAPLRGYAAALAAVVLVTVIIGAIEARAHVANISMLYLMAVLGAATRWAAVRRSRHRSRSFLAFNWFFVDPIHTLTVGDPQEWFALVLFLVTAVITSQLAADQRDRAREAADRARDATLMFEVARVLGEPDLEKALALVTDRLRDGMGVAARSSSSMAPMSPTNDRRRCGGGQWCGHRVARGVDPVGSFRDGRWGAMDQGDGPHGSGMSPRDDRVHAVPLQSGGRASGRSRSSGCRLGRVRRTIAS